MKAMASAVDQSRISQIMIDLRVDGARLTRDNHLPLVAAETRPRTNGSM
jgi:hypothetical protein